MIPRSVESLVERTVEDNHGRQQVEIDRT